MAFHFIVTCVSQKKAKKVHSILDPKIQSGPLEDVFNQWRKLLSQNNLKPKKAINLYKNPLWNGLLDSWGVINGRSTGAQMWILSAGYGLINAEDLIAPYDITFQDPRDKVPSIFSKITDLNGFAAKKTWWDCLIKSKDKEPNSLASLVSRGRKDDYYLIVLGKDYLDATFDDLKKAITSANKPDQIAIISNNVNDPTGKRLMPNWLYADSRFVNLPGSNSTLVNAKIAKKIVWHMFEEEKGLSCWDLDNFNTYLKKLSSELPVSEKPNRELQTDDQVQAYIRDTLIERDTPFSRLHRAFRDSGRACEYTRFRGIYNKVKADLKKETSKGRPNLKVHYKKRKTKMLFFLPDWDDRVDPLYDFEKDEPTPNRDPYIHDAYHYELYGTLNCDGILVSKSVLEGNSQKKEKVRAVGIHKFLRLPRNVPVLGDCGAFNYITEENPPYETNEILEYYETLGFDYGVSLDHLIVPGILKRKRYFRSNGIDWVKIKEDEYLRLKEKHDVSIIKRRRNGKQPLLFLEGDRICEETYIDEDERNRRYELTVENARQFIKKHRKGKYSFIPIGAVQGWDPRSYADAVIDYQRMGYSHVALGGLVRSTTSEILKILECVNKIRKSDTRIHLFGVARLDAIESFMKLGVTSVDSAGMLRQAWLSDSSNYYAPDLNHYTAIRIPPSEKGKKSLKAVLSGKVTRGKLSNLESVCLNSLRNYDQGKISLDEVLDSVMLYNNLLGGRTELYDKYSRTLLDQPWKKCPCKLCKEAGIEISIFRRNNRNRRRGFHNTWVFFNKFKMLTKPSRTKN